MLIGNVYVQAQVRGGQFHVGAFLLALGPPVCNRVFHAVGYIFRVAESLRIDGGIYRKTGLKGHIVAPIYLFGVRIYLVRIFGAESSDRH